MSNNSLGKKIKELRKYYNIKQKDLAQEFGIGQDDVSRLENGKQEIKIDLLKQYCKKFNVSSDYLLGFPRYHDLFGDIIEFSGLDFQSVETLINSNKSTLDIINKVIHLYGKEQT